MKGGEGQDSSTYGHKPNAIKGGRHTIERFEKGWKPGTANGSSIQTQLQQGDVRLLTSRYRGNTYTCPRGYDGHHLGFIGWVWLAVLPGESFCTDIFGPFPQRRVRVVAERKAL